MEHRPRDADPAHPRPPRSDGHPASGQSTRRVPRAGEKPWGCCLLTWPVQLPPPELELGRQHGPQGVFCLPVELVLKQSEHGGGTDSAHHRPCGGALRPWCSSASSLPKKGLQRAAGVPIDGLGSDGALQRGAGTAVGRRTALLGPPHSSGTTGRSWAQDSSSLPASACVHTGGPRTPLWGQA